MVFVIRSVYVMDYVYRFAYVEPALHPRDEADLILVDKIFDVLLDLVCHYYIENFATKFIRNIKLTCSKYIENNNRRIKRLNNMNPKCFHN